MTDFLATPTLNSGSPYPGVPAPNRSDVPTTHGQSVNDGEVTDNDATPLGPALYQDVAQAPSAELLAHPLRNRVEAALDTIRPYLMRDGGNVELHAITGEGQVQLRLLGACGACSMSMMTMRAGIEKAVLRSVPEVSSVVAINPPGALAEGPHAQ